MRHSPEPPYETSLQVFNWHSARAWIEQRYTKESNSEIDGSRASGKTLRE
jgi:hypothetical protein